MALDALRCNHLAPLGFKGLIDRFVFRGLCWYVCTRRKICEQFTCV